MSGRIAWISLTPVKATALHLVDEVQVLPAGLKDDRRFYFVGANRRLVNNKDFGPLQLVRADYDAEADALTPSLRRRRDPQRAGRARGGGRDAVPFPAAARPARATGRGRQRSRTWSGSRWSSWSR